MESSKRIASLLIIGYCFLILIVSLAALNGMGALNESKWIGIRSDYVLHVLLFIPWMILAAWRWRRGNDPKKVFWLALSAGLSLAAVSEAIQLFVSYRSFNLLDLSANGIGVAIGGLISLRRKEMGGRR
jgi:VanZ family protein